MDGSGAVIILSMPRSIASSPSRRHSLSHWRGLR